MSRHGVQWHPEVKAVSGVLARELINFSTSWRSTTFSSTVEPTVYLIAFGIGLGSVVSQIGGHSYVEYVGTGTVATTILFSAVFPGMFGTFVKHHFQRTYDVILAAPVNPDELVTAEALWIAARAAVFGSVPLLVAMAFGLEPAVGMVAVPPVAFIGAFGWASFGILMAAVLRSIDNFSYISSAVLAPTLVLAGVYFPLTGLPEWAQVLGALNPLHHCVELVRHASFGWHGLTDLGHVAVLVAFAAVTWRLAVWRMRSRLIE